MQGKQEVFAHLEKYNIPFFAYEHEPYSEIPQNVFLENGDEDGLHCKNLLLCNRQATKFFLVCIPAFKRYNTSQVSHQLGASRLQFASDDDVYRLLKLRPGYVSPFGLLNDTKRIVTLALDEYLLKVPKISFHPNTNDASLVFTRQAFFAYLQSIAVEPVFFQLSN